MEHIILIIHLLLAVSIIGLILLQRSEGGGLGIGGGSGGLGGLASAGTTGNILTKATGLCAAGFFTTSLILAVLAGTHSKSSSLLENLDNPPAVVDTIDKTSDNKLPKAKGDSKAIGSDSQQDSKEKTSTPSAPLSE